MVKSPSIRQFEEFYNRCVQVIMSISKTKQWKEQTTSGELFGTWLISSGNIGVCGWDI